MKVKLFLMCLLLFLEIFNFHYTFQGTKYPNGICSFYTIFNILFCFKKPFYAPCVYAYQTYSIRKIYLRLSILSPHLE